MESTKHVPSDEPRLEVPGAESRTGSVPETDKRIALCPHISVEHFRGGEKWVASMANSLAADDIDVSVRALPYVPDGDRRVDVEDVLEAEIPYSERWRHDLSGFDTAYIFYNPLSQLFFSGDTDTIAGVHSWVYVSDRLYERHYGPLPTAVKLLYRTIGRWDLGRFDAVHSVTPAFKSPHPRTAYIPNFVDTTLFHPDAAPLADRFTVLVTAAHIREKGWDVGREVAARLPDDVRFVATGTCDDPNVEDLGFLDERELAQAYASAHLVLHPARVDTDSMVINEACAAGTPVVTTSLPTHVRENEAVVHADSAVEMVGAVRVVQREWKNGQGYDRRCEVAREEGERHAFGRIYPQLRDLLLEPGAAAG
jgi:glycosyltransferase involved in cell wall biosynthesis